MGSAERPRSGGRVIRSSKAGGQNAEPVFAPFLTPEATAVWQWFRFLLSQVPPHTPVVRLNLDETSTRFWYEPRLGLRQPTGQVPIQGFALMHA